MRPFDKLTSWYFSRNALPYWSVLFLDVLIVIGCGVIAYIAGHGALYTLQNLGTLVVAMLLYAVCYIVSFKVFRTYSGVLRFSSFVDLWRIGISVAVGLFIALLVDNYLAFDRWFVPVETADLLLGAILTIALMWAVRIWAKLLYDNTTRGSRTKRAYIYGIKDDGVALAKSITTNHASPYELKGFVSDDMSLKGHHLLGREVFPVDETLPGRMERGGISALLVTRPNSEALRRNTELVNSLIDKGITILMFPDAQELGADKQDRGFTGLHEVNVEDLLPRDKIEVDMETIGNQLRGRRILITGAAGSIGSEMVRQIAPYEPAELLLIDQAETPLHDVRLMMKRRWPLIKAHTVVADIAHERRMEELFAGFRPEFVFHAAAYKHVPMMEDNPHESVANNIEGTRVVADLAVKYGTERFVMVSTDKAVNPTNVMGCSKRICEIYVQSLDKAIKDGKVDGQTRFVTTRFGNVLGSNGSVIPLFKEQIKAGGPVTVTHPDIIRFFMLIPEACKLVLEAGTMGNGGEIFVFDMGEPVRIADLARRMISMSGAKNVEIKFTGLRDGEKLYEEVLNEKEITLPTSHDKIKIARVREYDYAVTSSSIHELVELCYCGDDMRIVAMMKKIVPEFKSQHSRYEVLDK